MTPQPPTPGPWRKPALGLLFAAYFLLLCWNAIKAPFAADDMFAIYWYWHPSPWHLLTSQFVLWQGYLRPMGGLFYLPTFLLFGLDPVPYHVYLLVLVLLGVWLMYRLARVLGCEDLPAAVVALIACFHGGLSNLYWNSVFVFDVLVGIWFFAAITYYARIRSAGKLLTVRQMCVFLLLFLCSLNAKEMAVTLPVVLLAYEWLFHGPPPLRPAALYRWILGPGLGVFCTGLMNLLFIYGKRYGAEGLMNGTNPAYMPVLSLERFTEFNQRYIGDIFYHLPRFETPAMVAIWLVVTWLTWRGNRPLLRLCWVWIMVTPLPIAFIPGRDQACLYVCLPGWAIIAGVLFNDLVTYLAPKLVALDAQCRRIGVDRTRTRLAAACMLVFAFWNWSYKQTEVDPTMSALGVQTAEVLAEFRAKNPSVPPGTTAVFLDDPWHNAGYDMEFIAELWFRDRSTRVLLNAANPLTQQELDKAGALFNWQDGKLVRVR